MSEQPKFGITSQSEDESDFLRALRPLTDDDLAKRRRIVLEGCIEVLRERGLLAREVTGIGELLDLSYARGAFVRALGRTAAWPALLTALHARRIDEWLNQHRLVDRAWIQDWIASLAPLALPTNTPIDSVVFDRSPKPDAIGILADLGLITPSDEWGPDERPPMPAIERKDQFVARMKTAWNRRATLLGATPQKRKIETHAVWCAQLVSGATLSTVVADEPDRDISTIRKAVKSFSAFIEIDDPLKSGGNSSKS